MAVEGDEFSGDVDAAHDEANDGHDDIINERIDDFSEGAADDDPDCQFQDVSASNKLFKFFHHFPISGWGSGVPYTLVLMPRNNYCEIGGLAYLVQHENGQRGKFGFIY